MPLNAISSTLLRKMKKGRGTIADEAYPYDEDPIVAQTDRGYERNWKQFSHDPMRPKVQIRRERGRRAKHPI